VPPLRRIERMGALPLSFAQQRLWFLDQLEPGSSIYNIPIGVLLRGELEVGALEKTLSKVVRRHEVLRTSFPAVDGMAVQMIADPQPVELPLVDLSRVSPPARETTARRLAQEEGRRGFDLRRGPLLRAMLVRLGAQEHLIVLT